METQETIKLRRSIREYQNKPIAKEVLKQLVDAARFAPTARGIEPWEFVVITSPEVLEKIGQIAQNGRFVAQAQACIAVFCKETKYYLEDGCAATQNILLAATDLAIGSCWVAGDKKPYAQEISNLLGVPSEFKLVSLISLGYPQTKASFKIIPKRTPQELIHWEKF